MRTPVAEPVVLERVPQPPCPLEILQQKPLEFHSVADGTS